MKVVSASLAIFAFLVSAALADSINWSDEKKVQVSQNRDTNSGLGNGGEVQKSRTGWRSTGEETDDTDDDPGNSGNNSQGGKNE